MPSDFDSLPPIPEDIPMNAGDVMINWKVYEHIGEGYLNPRAVDQVLRVLTPENKGAMVQVIIEPPRTRWAQIIEEIEDADY